MFPYWVGLIKWSYNEKIPGIVRLQRHTWGVGTQEALVKGLRRPSVSRVFQLIFPPPPVSLSNHRSTLRAHRTLLVINLEAPAQS